MKPMLATAATALPKGEGWAFEFKWDGVRALLDVSEGGLSIHSRNGNDVTVAYPELAALAEGAGDALLDGEIVTFVDGRPSFEALQERMHVRSKTDALRLARRNPATFVAFDLLRRFGVDLCARPLADRRATLERWLTDDPRWTLSPVFDDGTATEAAARHHGLEGVVAKRLSSPYRPGARTPDWVKLRFLRSGDFVVVGWESPVAQSNRLSSLVLGYYSATGDLTLAGKVGSGLTGRISDALEKQLTPRAACVFPTPPPASPGRTTNWVEPRVVVEVDFATWTGEGRLRHPVFRRVRGDKEPEEALGDA